MPVEYSRTRGRKTIELPTGERIKVPVIIKVSFIDPVRRHQETEHNLDNTETSNRRVHVDQVHRVAVDEDGVATEDPPSASPESLFVERIDTWNAVDPVRRHQETQLTLDNVTGNDVLPPHFSNHERTHIYRYHQDPAHPNDNGVWVDTELIDEFRVIDPVQRHQERRYVLDNPTNAQVRDGDLTGQADTGNPDITIGGDAEGTEENPLRLDPFQNIVNWSGEVPYLVYGFTLTNFVNGSAGAFTDSGLLTDPQGSPQWGPWTNAPGPLVYGVDLATFGATGTIGTGGYLTSFDVELGQNGWTNPDFDDQMSGGPTIAYTPHTFAPSAWTFSTYTGNPFNQPTASGPPLIINDEEVTGYLDTLVETWTNTWIPLHTFGVYWQPGGVIPSATWFSGSLAVADVVSLGTSSAFNYTDSATMLTLTATVSPDPFMLTVLGGPNEGQESWWRVIGIRDPNIDVDSAQDEESTGFIEGFKDRGKFYIVPASEPE